MDKIRQLAEALYANEVSQFNPTGEGLFDMIIKYPHLTVEERHYWHKVWLFRSEKLLEKAESDVALREKINLFLEANLETDWIQTGFEIYKVAKSDFPDVTEKMVQHLRCCEVLDAQWIDEAVIN